jgi:hypothetical protein
MKKSRNQISGRLSGIFSDEKGVIAAWFALFLPVFIGIGALALDISYTMMLRQKLQVTASSAALAGAAGLITSSAEAVVQANSYADINAPQAGDVLPDSDIVVGTFDFGPPRVFTAGGGSPNAVKVTAHLSETNNNPVSLFLAGIFGMDQTNINVTATGVALANPQPDACMIALNESSDVTGLDLGGNSNITAGDNCGICVNSTSEGTKHNNAAMGANGTPSVDVGVGGAIYVGGTYVAVGDVDMNPPPEGGYDTLDDGNPLCPDPYADKRDDYEYVLDEPDPCAQDGANVAAGIPGVADGTPLGTHGLPIDPPPLATNIADPFSAGLEVPGLRYPGNAIYCSGITINGGTPIEFGAGDTFIYDPAPDDIPDININGISGGGDFVSTEVNPCGTTVCGGTTFIFSGSLIDINNSSSVNLTGELVAQLDTDGNPTGVNVPDFLFYQDPLRLAQPEDPNDAAFHKLTGGSDFFLNGIVHMGMEDLWVRGDIASDETYEGGCLTLLAGTFDLNGTVDLNINTDGCASLDDVGPTTYAVRLVD